MFVAGGVGEGGDEAFDWQPADPFDKRRCRRQIGEAMREHRSGICRMIRTVALAALCIMVALPGHAATCTEGLIMLDKTLRTIQLEDEEFGIVSDLMFKAKVEADRGNMQTCVYIVGDIIRLVFLPNGPTGRR
jgi:hypothetical protein